MSPYVDSFDQALPGSRAPRHWRRDIPWRSSHASICRVGVRGNPSRHHDGDGDGVERQAPYAPRHRSRRATSARGDREIEWSSNCHRLSPVLRETAPLVRYKREVERAVRASGMRWTIPQPSVFMEIWLSSLLGWNVSGGRAMTFGAGTAPMRWISVDDVAEHVVRSVNDPRLANRDLPLGGPEALSPNDVVAIFEAVSQRQFSVRRVPKFVLTLLGPVIARFTKPPVRECRSVRSRPWATCSTCRFNASWHSR